MVKTRRLTQDQTRARIMDRADVLFRQFGSSKTTVADIAEELGMSTANIYKFFPSKDAIIQAGAERSLSQIKERLLRAARTPKSASERLREVMLAIYRFHQEYFRHERQIYKLVISATEENWQCVSTFKLFLGQLVCQLIEDGMKTGEFKRAPAEAITQVLIDSFTWITNPILLPQLKSEEVAGRIRAQVQLLEKALK